MGSDRIGDRETVTVLGGDISHYHGRNKEHRSKTHRVRAGGAERLRESLT